MNGPGGISRVVIVGGGTAGWMTAAAMARLLIPAGIQVDLVESDQIGTIGVGEATLPTIKDFNALLGLDEDELLRATGGSFKLGIEFVDWLRPGHRYIHPFGQHGRDTQTLRFHHLWLKAFKESIHPEQEGLGRYSASTLAAEMGRFGRPSQDPNHPLSTLAYAFHFDASLYARLLRDWSEARGVTRTEGRVVSVRFNGDEESVAAVVLEDGSELRGDLFVDCSGFRALLLGEALAEPFITWSDWLLCDRAIAVPCDTAGPLPPFTRSTADSAGWRWRIPLQHRTGNGYVYSSAHLATDRAQDRLLATLDAPPSAEPREIRFVAGRRRTFWKHNVVGIGLAGGFLEPLESTSIHLIQTGVARLLTLFPAGPDARCERAEYNRQTTIEYEQIRDFIILHYKASERDDSAFWKHCRAVPLPDTLEHRIELFRSSGRIFRHGDELFSQDSWLAVLTGQGIMPHRHDPTADAIPTAVLMAQMAALRRSMFEAVERLPKHDDFIARHCASKATPR